MSSTASVNPCCHILLVAGSLRAGSTNAAVLNTTARQLPSGVTATIYQGIAELPHFNPDDDREPLPASVAPLRARLAEASAVLLSTPEYAGSLPGSFKNLLDWTVGGGMHDKPVAWINASAFGAAHSAHATLRVVLGYVAADIVDAACAQIPVRRDLVGADGTIEAPQVTGGIRATLDALVSRVLEKRAAAISHP